MSQDGMDARRAALSLLHEVLSQGRYVDDVFLKASTDLEDRDRRFVRNVVATTLRHLGQIDAVLDGFVEKRPDGNNKIIWTVLRLSAAQLLFLETAAHAVVDTGVRLAVNAKRPRFKGMVNAVLRKVADQGPALIANQDAPRLNTPPWMWDRWSTAYGDEQARVIAEAHGAQAPLDLSVKSDPAKWAKTLSGDILDGGTVRLNEASGKIVDLPGFSDGAWWVQDAAAARPAQLLLDALDDPAGKSVVDLCAAPGGKTAQLAAAGCQVTAIDASKSRMKRLKENIKRLDLNVTCVTKDATQWTPDQPPDAILVDAPCSATGTIRRHPELPWIKSSALPHALVPDQAKLLTRACDLVKPGGIVVYAVCSLEPEEGESQIEVLDRADMTVLSTERLFPGAPGDGFFIAVLQKL